MGYLPIEKLAKRYKVHRQTLWRHLSELKASGDIELVTGQKRGNKIRTEAKLLKKSEQKPKCHETAPQAAAHIKNVTTVNTWVCGVVVVALSQTALQARSVWVCWRYGEMRSAKQGKVPYNPKSSHYAHALPNDSSTWATYEQARARFLWSQSKPSPYDGIGLCFQKGMVGIDLDNCIHNGKIDAWAQKIIDRFNSYTEISPSGTGVHIIVLGSIPANRKSGSIEMYDHSRYFTYTGNRVPGTPETVEYRQDALDSLYLEITKVGYIDATPLSENSLHDVSGLSMLSDDEVLQKAQSNPKSGPKFSRLWAGDITLYITEQHPQGDHSRADQALVESLVYWCNGDTDMVDRLFRRSGLYRPEKWGREDYRARTIKRAFAFVGQLS